MTVPQGPGSYYSHSRTDLLQLMPDLRGLRVMEIGCGTGETLAFVKERGAAEVVGVEINESAARSAAANADKVLIANAESDELDLPPQSFDLLLMADVLEHFVNPWLTLKRMAGFLTIGGTLLASIPNVRHYQVLTRLVAQGRWDYSDAGLLDRTHLRFFTRDTIGELVTGAGFRIVELFPRIEAGRKMRTLNRFALGRLHDFMAYQYYVRAIRVQ